MEENKKQLRKCSMCGEEKPLSEFYSDKSQTLGKDHRCKDCSKKRRREWYQKNKDKAYKTARRLNLKNNFGITTKEYKKKLTKQEGVCAICKTNNPHVSRRNKNFCVDHNHTTGQIRGLLCNKCNLGLGFFDHSINRLKNAISYLKEYKE